MSKPNTPLSIIEAAVELAKYVESDLTAKYSEDPMFWQSVSKVLMTGYESTVMAQSTAAIFQHTFGKPSGT